MSRPGNTILEGTSTDWHPVDSATFRCAKCGELGRLDFRVWESSCGGYEDCNYRCNACGHNWWVDGDDG